MKKLCLVLLCVAAAGGVYAEGREHGTIFPQVADSLLFGNLKLRARLYQTPIGDLVDLLLKAKALFVAGQYTIVDGYQTTYVGDVCVTNFRNSDTEPEVRTLMRFDIPFASEEKARHFYSYVMHQIALSVPVDITTDLMSRAYFTDGAITLSCKDTRVQIGLLWRWY